MKNRKKRSTFNTFQRYLGTKHIINIFHKWMENFQQLISNSRKNVESIFTKKSHWEQTLIDWMTDCPYGSNTRSESTLSENFSKKVKNFLYNMLSSIFPKWKMISTALQVHNTFNPKIQSRNFSFLFYFHIKFSQFKINSSPYILWELIVYYTN